MPIPLTLTVEEPDVVLGIGQYGPGVLIRLQWSATETGAYADVTGTGSTPTIAIVSGQRSYPASDPNGTVSTWYRTRFENAGATRLSDWMPSFQPAPEGSGLICSLWDVRQELGETSTDANRDELILEKIRQVTDEIHHFTGRLFTRSPAVGTTTYVFDIESYSTSLWIPQGIAEASQVEIATQTGGAFTIVPTADWFLDPPVQSRDAGWPATRITLSNLPTGGFTGFYPGKRVTRVTMALGFGTVPYDIQAIGQRAVIASYLSKGSGVGGVATVGPSGAMSVLRYISPADREKLVWYSVVRM